MFKLVKGDFMKTWFFICHEYDEQNRGESFETWLKNNFPAWLEYYEKHVDKE